MVVVPAAAAVAMERGSSTSQGDCGWRLSILGGCGWSHGEYLE